MTDFEKAVYLSYIDKCLEDGDEGMAVDSYVEMKRREESDIIASYQDRELERMGE